MKKKDERSPEEIAKDLENIDFAEIDEEELEDVFGGVGDRQETSNSNCCC